MKTGKSYNANPEYTNLMNRERSIKRQIESLQKQLSDTTKQKQQTAPYIEI